MTVTAKQWAGWPNSMFVDKYKGSTAQSVAFTNMEGQDFVVIAMNERYAADYDRNSDDDNETFIAISRADLKQVIQELYPELIAEILGITSEMIQKVKNEK